MTDRRQAGRSWGRHGLGASFRFAFRGLVFGLRTQRNLRIHFGAASVAALASAALPLTTLEVAAVALAVAGVMITELFNTAIEATVDLNTRSFHPLAGLAKDAAAAAVLVASAFAVVVGALVFHDKIWPLLLRDQLSIPLALGLPLSLVFAAGAVGPLLRPRFRRRHPSHLEEPGLPAGAAKAGDV